MRGRVFVLTGAALLGLATVAGAQRATADFRATAVMPSQSLAGADLNVGIGFGATLAYRVLEHLHMYGGWDWIHFGEKNAVAGANRDFEETGYGFGLRFEHPLSSGSAAAYRVEGAGTWKHVEVENDAGTIIADSGHELGFEVGLGMSVPLGSAWNFSPALRYRSMSNNLTIATATSAFSLKYTGLEFGISRRF